jgi:hypothetical protein
MFDDVLLARLDADDEVRQMGRSAVLRRAAAEYLRRRRIKKTADAYRQAYGGSTSAVDSEFAGWPDEGAWPEK